MRSHDEHLLRLRGPHPRRHQPRPVAVMSNEYERVICNACGRQYRCTPSIHYYNWPGLRAKISGECLGGVCASCLLTTARR